MIKKIGRKAAVVIDGSHVSFEDILAVAKDGMPVVISTSKEFVKRMDRTQKALMDAMQNGVAVYGVNTRQYITVSRLRHGRTDRH